MGKNEHGGKNEFLTGNLPLLKQDRIYSFFDNVNVDGQKLAGRQWDEADAPGHFADAGWLGGNLERYVRTCL